MNKMNYSPTTHVEDNIRDADASAPTIILMLAGLYFRLFLLLLRWMLMVVGGKPLRTDQRHSARFPNNRRQSNIGLSLHY